MARLVFELVFESGERKEPNAFVLARPFPRTHLKLTSMALPSVSNEIMCDPLGDTATHWISVRFSDGNVAHDDSVRSTSVTRLPMLVNSFVPRTHRLPPRYGAPSRLSNR